MSNLVPKTIIDKNGKRTTVHVSIDPRYETDRLGNINYDVRDYHPQTIGGWEIASPGNSGMVCPECRHEFTEDEERTRLLNTYEWACPSCSSEFEDEHAFIAVRDDCAQFFDDDVVRETEWYHATTRMYWQGGVALGSDLTRLVHVGTKEAALQRIWFASEMEMELQNAEWFIVKVKLNPDIPIHPDVMADDTFGEPETVGEARRNRDYEAEGVTRYVNGFEQTGSISLVVNADKFTVEEVIQVGNKDDVWADRKKELLGL